MKGCHTINSLFPESAIDESLLYPLGCQVLLKLTFNKQELLLEFLNKRFLAVPHRGKTAAAVWAVCSKRGKNQMTVCIQSTCRLSPILLPEVLIDQKVKHSTVVLHVEVSLWQLGVDNIRFHPMHARSCMRESLLRSLDGAGCNVQDGDVRKTALQKVINKRRIAPADVDNPGIGSNSSSGNKLE